MKIVSKVRKLVRLTLRARVAAAFAKIAGAVDARTAQRRTRDLSLKWGRLDTFPELIAIRPRVWVCNPVERPLAGSFRCVASGR